MVEFWFLDSQKKLNSKFSWSWKIFFNDKKTEVTNFVKNLKWSYFEWPKFYSWRFEKFFSIMRKYLILERIWNNPVLDNRNFWILREKLNFTSILEIWLNKNRLLWFSYNYVSKFVKKLSKSKNTLVKHDWIVEARK